MAKDNSFHCQLITPDASLVDTKTTSVVVPAHDGEIGILLDRAPLLCKLGIGGARIQTAEGTLHYYIDGGYMHVFNNEVAILTSRACLVDQIDVPETQRQLDQWQETKVVSLEEQNSKSLEIQRLKIQLHLAQRRK